HRERLEARYRQWQDRLEQWRASHPELAAQLDRSSARHVPADLLEKIPHFSSDYADATRGAGGVVMQHLAKAMPDLFTGSADLFGSTKNYIKEGGDFSRDNRSGRNVWFGIREHAMGAALNGAAYDGLFRPTGATFTV